jgi:hypothetical protein
MAVRRGGVGVVGVLGVARLHGQGQVSACIEDADDWK